MRLKNWKQSLSLLVCSVLIAALALMATGCSGNTTDSSTSSAAASSEVTSSEAASSEAQPASPDTAASQAAGNVLGQGATAFTFTVVDGDGNETSYQINTDQTTVGDALVELGLIAGDESDYGLYIKTVDGITVDYDTDGKYWAFYVDGEYASTGVDSTPVTAGSTYTFKVE